MALPGSLIALKIITTLIQGKHQHASIVFSCNINLKNMQTELKLKPPSLNDRILKYLKEGNRITPLNALILFNCMSLAQRIKDLKDDGHFISTTMIKTKSGKRVAEYSYIKKN
jgi:hypothetical protein